MNDVLKTWGHIIAGLSWVMVLLIFAVGVVTVAKLAESKTLEIKIRDRQTPSVNKKTSEEKCNSKSEGCQRDEDRDPVTGNLPTITLPKCFRVKNCASKKDGRGMNCVACIETAANYQYIKPLYGILDREKLHNGGGWPEKIASILKREQDENGSFSFEQYEGKEFADCIEKALDADKIPCVSYGAKGHGPYTMVCVLHLDSSRACIFDPNFIDKVEWLSRDEFLKNTACNDGGAAWVITLQKTASR